MAEILDDKSEHCIPFILERLKDHQASYHIQGKEVPPFFLGLNGVQGAGKTTLVTALHRTLTSPPYNLSTVVLSIDDLYLPHAQQQALAASHPQNPLVQHRGQPSTHDIPLAISLFDALGSRDRDIRIPRYDKSAYNGQGDRAGEEEWDMVNRKGEATVEVVVFEGWCVGFRALGDEELERKWEGARREAMEGGDGYVGQLGRLRLEDMRFVNDKLREYDSLTDRLNAFIHIDAENTQYVYKWRLQQEAALRATKGRGMTDEQVVSFVNGYYPAYEVYSDVLRHGIYPSSEAGKQLRLVVDEGRRVKQVYKI